MTFNIELKGVETNNLKAIDVCFPLGKLTVVTGVSGSGKSSLVFDSLYSESYRRYIASLSSFARQYLKILEKPKIRAVENLPAAVAVKQGRGSSNNRSTVGTATELVELLRVVFAHKASVFCWNCGRVVARENSQTIYEKCAAIMTGQQVMILAPMKRTSGMSGLELKQQLMAQGFTKVLVSGIVARIADAKPKDILESEVILDRIKFVPENSRRIVDAIGMSLRVGRGGMTVQSDSGTRDAYSSAMECAHCELSYREPSTALLSFNHPLGACTNCQGYGNQQEINWDSVTPDLSGSIKSKGVVPLNFGQHAAYYVKLMNFAVKRDLDPGKVFADYTQADWEWFKFGDGKKFLGMTGYFQWLDTKKYKAHYRMHAARFKRYVICEACHGQRLGPAALACKIKNQSIAEVCNFSIRDLDKWLDRISNGAHDGDHGVGISSHEAFGAGEALSETKARVSYLLRVGLSYLTLTRSSGSLSGGELQRINMARCLGSALTETLYCLDEPTAGLHAQDSATLLQVIYALRDQGNTVVVVEHEKTIIDGADKLIEIGPVAGHLGGRIQFAGAPTPPATPLIDTWQESVREFDEFIYLKNVSTHNLKSISVKIPLGSLTVVCGVSGSGKTSLVQHSLYPALLASFASMGAKNGLEDDRCKLGPMNILGQYGEAILVNQTSLARSSRSNIATYLGIFDQVRKIFSEQPLAKKLGVTPGAFSFNVAGGRCETCKGLGTVIEDLSFLGEMAVKCPSCEGRCFKDEILNVLFRERNLVDILGLTVAEAREFFFDEPKIRGILDGVINMGLGYLTLGQNTSSFSGGEAQRLKLLRLLTAGRNSKPAILIFDEPTTGLSDFDVRNLLMQFRKLTDGGHLVIIVEHHLGVIRSADWVIEIGPGAAEDGGMVTFQGKPRQMAQCEGSVTGQYL
jgi:excinuclease ABC subunit A